MSAATTLRIDGGREISGAARAVTIAAGRIVDTGDATATIDATGLIVVPGYVDLQVNGAGGVDLTSEPEGLWRVASLLPRFGVTSFLPTLVSPPGSLVDRALDILADGPPVGFAGARPLGWHIEGPYIAPARRGAHPAHAVAVPGPDAGDGWSARAGVAMVTLAPELPGAGPLIQRLVRRGVVVGAGHSDAGAEAIRDAVGHGLRAVTHLFNAMSGVHHREPGIAGAVLDGLDVTSSMIADGVHLSPEALRLAWRLIPAARRVLVSDASAALGAPPGPTLLAGRPVMSDGSIVRGPDGVLAGSACGLDAGVRNIVAATGCEPAEAIAAVTTNPATLLGRDDIGEIRPGGFGDVTLLDETFAVAATVVGGSVVYRRAP